MTAIHHVRVTGTAGGVRIGETGELVLTGQVYLTPEGNEGGYIRENAARGENGDFGLAYWGVPVV